MKLPIILLALLFQVAGAASGQVTPQHAGRYSVKIETTTSFSGVNLSAVTTTATGIARIEQNGTIYYISQTGNTPCLIQTYSESAGTSYVYSFLPPGTAGSGGIKDTPETVTYFDGVQNITYTIPISTAFCGVNATPTFKGKVIQFSVEGFSPAVGIPTGTIAYTLTRTGN